MDSNQKNTGWIVAGILALVVVVLLVMMWTRWNEDQKDLDHVLQEGKEDISSARDEIAEKCNGPRSNDLACNDALNELKAILEDFGEDVNQASTSGSVNGSVSPQ